MGDLDKRGDKDMHKRKAMAIALVATIVILSGTVLGEYTSLTAKVNPGISITPPEGLSSWTLNPAIVNTHIKSLIVNANAPWKVSVKSQNGSYMQARGSNDTYSLEKPIELVVPGATPLKPTSTSKTLLEGTTPGANQNFPVTFQQQGSFNDDVSENSTPLMYSIVITFTGSLQ